MKKIYKIKWTIITDDGDEFLQKELECYKATKESAVLTVNNIKSAFEDLGYKKEHIKPITIEEVTLT